MESPLVVTSDLANSNSSDVVRFFVKRTYASNSASLLQRVDSSNCSLNFMVWSTLLTISSIRLATVSLLKGMVCAHYVVIQLPCN